MALSGKRLKMIKTCGIYFQENAIYVISDASTPMGTVSVTLMQRLERDVDTESLGVAVQQSLDAFQYLDEVLDPKEKLSELLKFVGEKSWGAFAKKSIHVFVTQDRKKIQLIPTRKEKRGSFSHLINYTVATNSDPVSIGRELMALVSN
jgi:hypothetical protein